MKTTSTQTIHRGHAALKWSIASAAMLCASAAMAQNWPDKPVHLIVAFPPGGIVDTVARQLQPKLQSALGQPVIVENRAGAGGTVGAAEVARATPDGYKLLMVFDSYATYSLTYPKLTFNPAKDLTPVTQIARNPLILVVNPQVKAQSVKDLVALSKADPKALNYASVGAGSSNHLTAELFKSVSGMQAMHVPYKGGGPAMQDLLGGQVQMMFLSAVLAQPHVQGGKLRAVAQTGSQRVAAFASVPTVAESGYPGFDVNSWVGLLAPAATPKPVVERLNKEIRAIVQDPAFSARLQEQGLSGIGNTPEQFAKALEAENKQWTQLVRERQLSMD
ncbi:Bug family tripartite tricarboxylate transporter substrate binding protein [Diaphorobacter caeni]|uniref:Bug family tripartite tricarboxylate transporter substrate binding protein n=1 Tax=Diaphorobacter caeni TaxID=2784387 RepID=UPI00188FDA98|nr:tripartite tricarboxylate transporter substrate binding protein [Diaphorobacter caeni]MBF5005766.1 tripartite tricarboxylate transporter substrate binding protein [Diaphorobacter caeni]